LQKAKALYGTGERKSDKIISSMERIITSAKDARIDYISIVDDETLEEIEEINRPVLVALGVFFGVTRLIDNTVLS
jgi:pantoate--beta-alanine ligase